MRENHVHVVEKSHGKMVFSHIQAVYAVLDTDVLTAEKYSLTKSTDTRDGVLRVILLVGIMKT